MCRGTPAVCCAVCGRRPPGGAVGHRHRRADRAATALSPAESSAPTLLVLKRDVLKASKLGYIIYLLRSLYDPGATTRQDWNEQCEHRGAGYLPSRRWVGTTDSRTAGTTPSAAESLPGTGAVVRVHRHPAGPGATRCRHGHRTRRGRAPPARLLTPLAAAESSGRWWLALVANHAGTASSSSGPARAMSSADDHAGVLRARRARRGRLVGRPRSRL